MAGGDDTGSQERQPVLVSLIPHIHCMHLGCVIDISDDKYLGMRRYSPADTRTGNVYAPVGCCEVSPDRPTCRAMYPNQSRLSAAHVPGSVRAFLAYRINMLQDWVAISSMSAYGPSESPGGGPSSLMEGFMARTIRLTPSSSQSARSLPNLLEVHVLDTPPSPSPV